jgi:hypothetical protein
MEKVSHELNSVNSLRDFFLLRASMLGSTASLFLGIEYGKERGTTMKLRDLVTPELLDRSIHPGRELTEDDFKESRVLIEENKELMEVFSKCHATCAGTEGMELKHDNAIAGAVLISLDRAIRQATADASPQA